MKKLAFTLSAVLITLLTINQEAQAQRSYGTAGIDLVLPLEEGVSDFGAGLNLGYEIGVTENIGVNAHVGFINYFTNSETTDFFGEVDYYKIPLQVGARYYLDESRSGFFLGAKVGVHIDMFATEDWFEEITTLLSAAPEVGYFLSENFSVSARYQLIFISEDAADLWLGEEGINSSIAVTGAFHF